MPKIAELKRKSSSSFQAYSVFNDGGSDVLKAWNRCATFFNIIKDIDMDNARSYIRQFSNDEINKVNTILAMIRRDGYEDTKRRVMKGDVVFLEVSNGN